MGDKEIVIIPQITPVTITSSNLVNCLTAPKNINSSFQTAMHISLQNVHSKCAVKSQIQIV